MNVKWPFDMERDCIGSGITYMVGNIFTPVGVELWMTRPKLALGGRSPAEVILTGSEEEIQQVIDLADSMRVTGGT